MPEGLADEGIIGAVAVYLNVLGVVVLAEPSDAFCLDESPDPEEIHGVDRLVRLDVPSVETVDDNAVEGEVF